MFLAFFCLLINGSLPNTFIEPFVLVSIPNSNFIVVDFPAPLFPIYPTISPSLLLRLSTLIISFIIFPLILKFIIEF